MQAKYTPAIVPMPDIRSSTSLPYLAKFQLLTTNPSSVYFYYQVTLDPPLPNGYISAAVGLAEYQVDPSSSDDHFGFIFSPVITQPTGYNLRL